MRKKKSRSQLLKKELDILWSRKIRTRDEVCQKCQRAPASQAAHIFTRNHFSTRWDLRNGIGMCYYCHIIWGHREPVEFTEWIRERLGEELFQELKKLSNTSKVWYVKDLEDELKKINGEN